MKTERERIKILGVAGSPRRDGNTTSMVKYCLQWAESLGYVDTEFLSLADYELKPCTGCMKCFGYMAPADDDYRCYRRGDEINLIAPKILQSDGLLFGFPVYCGGPPSLFRTFIEKLNHFGPMSFTAWSSMLRFKALGIIAQGGQVYGGQELNFVHLSSWGGAMGMYNVNAWPSKDAPMPASAFKGGIITTIDGMAIYGKNAWMKEATRTVPPASGSRNERTLKNLGRQLAVAAMTLKLGRRAFKEAAYAEPEPMPFRNYSVKPKEGSYVDKLIKEGKVAFVPKEALEARKQARSQRKP